jgi:hypothetical protein
MAVQLDLPPPLGAGGTCDVCEIAAPVEQIPEHWKPDGNQIYLYQAKNYNYRGYDSSFPGGISDNFCAGYGDG